MPLITTVIIVIVAVLVTALIVWNVAGAGLEGFSIMH